jgi:hypothetical protein
VPETQNHQRPGRPAGIGQKFGDFFKVGETLWYSTKSDFCGCQDEKDL